MNPGPPLYRNSAAKPEVKDMHKRCQTKKPIPQQQKFTGRSSSVILAFKSFAVSQSCCARGRTSNTQHCLDCHASPRSTERSGDSGFCWFSNETSFNPRAGSSTRLMVEAHRPHSQKWTVSRCGFSSKGAEPSSLAASEIETKIG